MFHIKRYLLLIRKVQKLSIMMLHLHSGFLVCSYYSVYNALPIQLVEQFNVEAVKTL